METESKWKDVKKGEMVRRLKQLGAWKEFEGLIRDTFYDTLEGRLASKSEIIRFRTKIDRNCEPVYYITHKGPFCGSAMFKRRPEQECRYDEVQFRFFKYVFEQAGVKPISSREKKRASYRWELISPDYREFVTVEIDRYPGLRPILEIEGKEHAIRIAAEKLGLSMANALGDNWQSAFPGYDFDDCRFPAKE